MYVCNTEVWLQNKAKLIKTDKKIKLELKLTIRMYSFLFVVLVITDLTQDDNSTIILQPLMEE